MARPKQTKRKRALLAAEAAAAEATAEAAAFPGDKADNDERRSKNEIARTNPSKTENPLLDRQSRFMDQPGLTDTERHELFSPSISSDRRAELWMAQADVGESLVNEYAWATPNATAIRIMKEFGPLVEMGCGSNAYWCKLLRNEGVDIVGYDVNIASGGFIEGKNSTTLANKDSSVSRHPSYIQQGGPDILSSKALKESGRTLFLCYPDEHDGDVDTANEEEEEEESSPSSLPTSMGWQSLHHYSGEYVIHVGETFLDANFCMDQAPWGRSSSPEFQQRLASEFHCLLKVELPNWLHTRDSLSVWKRSTVSTIVFADDDADADADDEEVEYRHIPRSERLPMNIAAPCLEHLLSESKPTNNTTRKMKKNKPNHSSEPIQQTTDHLALRDSTGSTSRPKKTKHGKKRHVEEGLATIPQNARTLPCDSESIFETNLWRVLNDAAANDGDSDTQETPW